MIYNVRASVVELIEAASPEEAYRIVLKRLDDAGLRAISEGGRPYRGLRVR